MKSKPKKLPFVVALGASAGGLEDYQNFFNKMPLNSGMAFVVITHLEPMHASFLTELIQKHTKIPVAQIKNNMPINPNKIYVIPPRYNVEIKNNLLVINPQDLPISSNHPINIFFESVAQNLQENACGIILSGAGFDGTIGIKKIKDNGGLVIVQDPKEAKFDSMPLSAINTGMADYIIPINEMPKLLLKFKTYEAKQIKSTPETNHNNYLKIFNLVKTYTGHDFCFYKLNTLYRRIDRQMLLHNITDIEQYIEYLESNKHEIIKLFQNLTIGVTSFFRDPEAFDALKSVIPNLFSRLRLGNNIRIWIPGCSTGEEAYSVAMLIREYLDENKLYNTIQIFSTDIDSKALATARLGLYPASIAMDVTSDRLNKFFFKENNRYRIKPEIRQMIVFGEQNLLRDPPFTKLDMICCRNLMIYLNPTAQKKLFPLFHYSLKPKGILFLGSSETTTGSVNLFKPLIKKWKIFERNDDASSHFSILNFSNNTKTNNHLQTTEPKVKEEKDKGLESHFEKLLLEQFVCPCFITNKKGKIFYKHYKVHYPAYKKSEEDNFFDYFPHNQTAKIKTAIIKAIKLKRESIIANMPNPNEMSHVKTINIRFIPIKNTPPLKGAVLVILEDIIQKGEIKTIIKKYGTTIKMSKKIHELETKLEGTQESLHMSIEELQSSNEELQSTNEELQSTNEEIETSREELQSLNEELILINNQLQNRIKNFTDFNDDMINLYNSTGVAAIFLDNQLRVKRFTPNSQKFIRLLDKDVGRSIKDFAINFVYEDFFHDIHTVLSELNTKKIEVSGKDNKKYLISILPYRTTSNLIDGVIITFNDIPEYKEDEKNLTK